MNINWTKWSAIAEIISSFAILVTLVYLAVQTQQNTEAIQANSRQAVIEMDLQALNEVIADPDIWLDMTKPNLTDREAARLQSWLITMWRTREHQWLQYQNGVLDEKTWKSYLGGLTSIFFYPRTRSFWNKISQTAFDKGFVQVVNDYLRTIPVRPAKFECWVCD